MATFELERDPAWEAAALKLTGELDFETARTALLFLERMWNYRDKSASGSGTRKANALVLAYLSGEDKVKRAFAVRYVKEYWGAHPGMGKKLYWDDQTVTLTPQAEEELRAAGVPESFIKDLKALQEEPRPTQPAQTGNPTSAKTPPAR